MTQRRQRGRSNLRLALDKRMGGTVAGRTRGKYGAIKVQDDGMTFDSKAEHRRYLDLRVLELSGEIRSLVVHPSWTFMVNGEYLKQRSKGYPGGRKVKYEADFQYIDLKKDGRGVIVVEDVKGGEMDPPVGKLKRALMELIHQIQVVVVKY